MSFDTTKKMKTSNDTIKTLRKERKKLQSNFKEMCKHGNNNNKIKAKEEYLNCQNKLRNEIGKEETKRNDDKLMTLTHSGGNNFWQIRKKILRQKPDLYNLVNKDGNEIENKLEAMEYMEYGPGQQHSQQHKFTLGPQELEATDTYKYLGITINTKGDLSDPLKITKGRTQASTHLIINLASCNPLKGIQMETIWKLYRTYTLPMITYGSEAWIMNNQEKQQIQSINNKNLKTILMTPDTTPGIALRTETAMADITQEIDLKQIKYLISQENRVLNNHIKNSIWEKKITGTCMQHNVDIDHLKTLENLKQRE